MNINSRTGKEGHDLRSHIQSVLCDQLGEPPEPGLGLERDLFVVVGALQFNEDFVGRKLCELCRCLAHIPRPDLLQRIRFELWSDRVIDPPLLKGQLPNLDRPVNNGQRRKFGTCSPGNAASSPGRGMNY
jgi:hypothetical protein